MPHGQRQRGRVHGAGAAVHCRGAALAARLVCDVSDHVHDVALVRDDGGGRLALAVAPVRRAVQRDGRPRRLLDAGHLLRQPHGVGHVSGGQQSGRGHGGHLQHEHSVTERPRTPAPCWRPGPAQHRLRPSGYPVLPSALVCCQCFNSIHVSSAVLHNL